MRRRDETSSKRNGQNVSAIEGRELGSGEGRLSRGLDSWQSCNELVKSRHFFLAAAVMSLYGTRAMVFYMIVYM